MCYDFSLCFLFKTFFTLFIGFSLDMVLFVVSLHIGKFLWLLFRILPPRKKLNNRRLDNMKPRVCRSGLCVINSTPKVGKTFQTAKYPFEKPLKQQLTRNFLIYQVWGLAPIPPPSGSTPKHFVLSEKDLYSQYTKTTCRTIRESCKNKLPGRIDGVPTSLAALFFPYRTNTVKRFPSSTGLSCVSVHKPISLPQGQQDQTQTKYYQFHNTVILIS